MCCEPILDSYDKRNGPDGECKECGEPTYKGQAEGCCYSPVECEECGYAPCDYSC